MTPAYIPSFLAVSGNTMKTGETVARFPSCSGRLGSAHCRARGTTSRRPDHHRYHQEPKRYPRRRASIVTSPPRDDVVGSPPLLGSKRGATATWDLGPMALPKSRRRPRSAGAAMASPGQRRLSGTFPEIRARRDLRHSHAADVPRTAAPPRPTARSPRAPRTARGSWRAAGEGTGRARRPPPTGGGALIVPLRVRRRLWPTDPKVNYHAVVVAISRVPKHRLFALECAAEDTP